MTPGLQPGGVAIKVESSPAEAQRRGGFEISIPDILASLLNNHPKQELG
jgi:hypothetical protein